MSKPGIVYIVHHIDTEGPLYESLEDLFSRINNTFSVDLEPSIQNIENLRENTFNIEKDKHKEILYFLEPHFLDFNSDWSQIEKMTSQITSNKFRNKDIDSFGGGWLFNWHVMDHVGFNDINPRRRTLGYHQILDYYIKLVKTNPQDSIHWHFHPISFSKSAHIPATSYDNSMNVLHDIISRRLIDKHIFPVVNRAGFHTVRPDSNLFLEQWIPFDASNQSVDASLTPKHQNDFLNGRFGDWRGAPDDWSIYSPDFKDWRKSGKLNRKIARVLNMKSRHKEINQIEIKKAFEKAICGDNVYLGITNHDWRNMEVEIDEFRDLFLKVKKSYPGVNYKYSETKQAFRAVLNFGKQEPLNFNIDLINNVLKCSITTGEIFGPQPYLAIKTINENYLHDNFDFGKDSNQFTYTFDSYTVSISEVKSIFVASNDKYGNTCIKSINL